EKETAAKRVLTPDGYSTETPEHLHIVYVKIPWRASNRRNPFPQMVRYVRQLEAIQVQRAYIEEFYGEDPDFDLEEFERQALDDDDDEVDERNMSVIEEGDEGETGDEDQVEVERESDLESGEVESAMIHYPRPSISIARRPTVRHVSGHMLIKSYHMTDLLRALRLFIATRTRPHHQRPLILATDHFDVWHKATLKHLPLPFAPNQPCHRDVVRVHPAIRDSSGHIKATAHGVFNTGLFALDSHGVGLGRFRAGRVRGIFTLPTHLQNLYSGPLVFLDVFTRFTADPTSTHHLYRTTPTHHNGGYGSL
ncbi:hypothetical protein FRC07_013081, partial [Ceratobasidium sp. 392]